MNRLLIDTNVLIDAVRGRRGRAELLSGLLEQQARLCTCAIVVAEIYSGVHAPELAAMDEWLATFEFLPTTSETARMAGRMRKRYSDKGHALDVADALIAAVAISHNVHLVTANRKDFPMPELSLYPPLSVN
jgi:predicted nucleic acid-binding protein